MDFTLFTILPVENDLNSFYRTKIECSDNIISLIIFDNSTAYKGEITSEYISNQSNKCKLSEKQYVEECLKAFQNSQSPEFTYCITADGYFHLKKIIQRNASNAIKVKFFTVKLEKVDFQPLLLAVLDSTLTESKQYVKKVEELQSANEALLKGNELLLKQLNQLQNDKSNMESVLYYRFLNLLNAKKRKLKELKRNSGGEIDEDEASEIDEMELRNCSPENAYDIDTDVDEEVKTIKDEPKHEEISATFKPSCSKSTEIMKNTQNVEESSKTPSIFEQMSILDPTVPFV